MNKSWNIEQVWGSDRFYYEGDVASNQYAFIIDSGISNLDDLNVNGQWSKSFVSGSPNPFEDLTGHGTAVASIIGSKANNDGLTGVAPGAELISLRVFSTGYTTQTRIEDALKHAKEIIVSNNLYDSAVINMSLGAGSPNRHPMVLEMAAMGIKFSISSGNSGIDVDGVSPSSYGHHPNVYVASSNAEDGYYSPFTNFDGVDLNGEDDSDFCAPGSRVETYNTDGTIRLRNGTSFSAPHLAGILLMSEEIRPGQTFTMNDDQVEKGMIPDPLGMFDPYTYKHGPSTGEPKPEPPPESIAPIVLFPRVPEDDKIRIKGDSANNFIEGGDNKDKLHGLRGNDTIFSFEGDDIIRGGKGDDYLDAGVGADFIIGGFGSNIYADQRDGEVDVLAIKYDTNPSGIDIIQGLDYADKIIVKNVYDHQISFKGMGNDIGIFSNESLTALYTGNNLTITDIEDMVLGLV